MPKEGEAVTWLSTEGKGQDGSTLQTKTERTLHTQTHTQTHTPTSAFHIS